MSQLHLATGESFPPLVDGKSRILSMEFCPFAQRARLVALAKDLVHDVVNINLKDKPQWIFDYHKEGKVPVLLHDGQVIPESNDICDYLEEQIPTPVLTNPDPKLKEDDLILRETFSKVLQNFYGCLQSPELTADGGFENSVTALQEALIPFEEALKERKTKFFNGNDFPGLLDYIIWPWFERFAILDYFSGHNTQHGDNDLIDFGKLSLLNKWQRDMTTIDAVKKTRCPLSKHIKLVQLYRKGGSVNYDEI